MLIFRTMRVKSVRILRMEWICIMSSWCEFGIPHRTSYINLHIEEESKFLEVSLCGEYFLTEGKLISRDWKLFQLVCVWPSASAASVLGTGGSCYWLLLFSNWLLASYRMVVETIIDFGILAYSFQITRMIALRLISGPWNDFQN